MMNFDKAKNTYVSPFFLILGGILIVFTTINSSSASSAVPPTETEMVAIPEGEFIMGSSRQDIEWAAQKFFSESLDYYQDETPAHKRSLPKFEIDKTEVTFAQYSSYLEKTGKQKPKLLDDKRFNQNSQPMVGITWQEANDYCHYFGKQLPTEAQWEKAARGPKISYYPWGNEPLKTHANVRGKKDGFRYTAPVGSYKNGASVYGVLDLAGNAWEWTADWYQPHPGNTVKNDLYGEKFKVIKGGSWFSNLDLARISVRGKNLPDRRQNYIGFRCVK